MYKVLEWKDHAVSPSNTYNVKENADGTITLTPAGKIIQQGTNMSAVNFNNLETGVLASSVSGIEALNAIRLALDKNVEHDKEFGKTEAHFKDVEDNIHAVDITAVEAARVAKIGYEKVKALEGFVVKAELTNTLKYPFNNSQKTIAITSANTRVTKDYNVIVEVESYSGGCVGDIVISDKMLNGFKVSHTGSAKSVNLKIYVHGGI